MNPGLPGSLNMLDLILAVWLLLYILRGLRGLMPELAGLAGILLGLVVAGNQRVHEWAVGWLGSAWGHSWWNNPLAYAGVFLLVCILAFFALNFLNQLFTRRTPGWPDRLLGGLVGGAKGAILAGFFLSLYAYVAPDSQMSRGSLLAPWIGELWAVLERLTGGFQRAPF